MLKTFVFGTRQNLHLRGQVVSIASCLEEVFSKTQKLRRHLATVLIPSLRFSLQIVGLATAFAIYQIDKER